MTCPVCEGPIPPRKPGPGRPRSYCSVPCRMEHQRRLYRARVDAENQARRERWHREWEEKQRAWNQDRINRRAGKA